MSVTKPLGMKTPDKKNKIVLDTLTETLLVNITEIKEVTEGKEQLKAVNAEGTLVITRDEKRPTVRWEGSADIPFAHVKNGKEIHCSITPKAGEDIEFSVNINDGSFSYKLGKYKLIGEHTGDELNFSVEQ